MTQRTGGFRKKTRQLFRKHPRDRGKIKINSILQEFQVGERVRVMQEPSRHKGMPDPKYRNRVGTIIAKQGKAYMIKVKDINKEKQILSKPEHLIRM